MNAQKYLETAKETVLKYRVIIVTLIILGLFGSTLLKLQGISNPQVDEAYLTDKRTENPAPSEITVDQELIDKIDDLESTTVDVTPDRLGTDNPFNP